MHPNHTEDSLQQKEMMNKMVYHSKCCYLEWTPPIQRAYLISYPTANSSLEGLRSIFQSKYNLTGRMQTQNLSYCITRYWQWSEIFISVSIFYVSMLSFCLEEDLAKWWEAAFSWLWSLHGSSSWANRREWKWHNFTLSLNKGSFPGYFLNWKIAFKQKNSL